MSVFISLQAEFGVAGLLPLASEQLISPVGRVCSSSLLTCRRAQVCLWTRKNNLRSFSTASLLCHLRGKRVKKMKCKKNVHSWENIWMVWKLSPSSHVSEISQSEIEKKFFLFTRRNKNECFSRNETELKVHLTFIMLTVTIIRTKMSRVFFFFSVHLIEGLSAFIPTD